MEKIIVLNEEMQFKLSLAQKARSNVYIFEGPKGLGKFTMAKEFARKITCKEQALDNCNCTSCRKLSTCNHPDIFIYRPEKEGKKIKVNTIRSLLKETYSLPLESPYKIYIVDDADSMTTEAQNSLLKTLESCPKHNIFIFVAHNTLLSTINSRGMKFQLERLSNLHVNQYLSKLDLSVYEKDILLSSGQGRIGRIHYLLDNKEIINELIELWNILNQLPFRSLADTLEALGLLKEKDKNSFYERNKEFLEEVIYVMEDFYLDVIKILVDDKKNMTMKNFNYGATDQPAIKEVYPFRKTNYALDFVFSARSLNKKGNFTKDDFISLIGHLHEMIVQENK